MRRPARVLSGLLLGALLLTAACKKTVENQTARWTAANKTADELGAVYPGFKGALEEQRARAKAVYDSATSITDEKAKIEKLATACDTLQSGFVTDLDNVDSKLKALRAKLVDAAGAGQTPEDKSRLDSAITETRRTIMEIDGRLKTGAKSASDAAAIVARILSDVNAADALLTKAIPAKITVDAGKAGSAPPPANDQQAWVCEYCNHSNDPKAEKCSNCGAPRPAKK